MIKDELAVTAAKIGGGGITYIGTYETVARTLPLQQASDVASLLAAVATMLYFTAQLSYTIWKWRHECNIAHKRGKHE